MAKANAVTVEEAEKMAQMVDETAAPWPPPISQWTVDGKSVAHVAHFIGYANTDQGKADPRAAEAAIWFRGLATGLPKSDNPLDNALDLKGSDLGRQLEAWEDSADPEEKDPFSAKLAWLKKNHPAQTAGMVAKFFHMPVVEERGGPGVGDEGYVPLEIEGKAVRVGDQVLHVMPEHLAARKEQRYKQQNIATDQLVTSSNNAAASVAGVAQGAANPLSAFQAPPQR